ncbi:MAG: hypothetical protein MZU79_07130 [Anaerotruncus sp.]|nr:hypothetical protein [Anaerotruncus sp.]
MAVKVAVVAPAGTVTVAGTCAAPVLPEVRLTTAPPVGAGLSRVTVPVEDAPPNTVAGLTLTPLSAADRRRHDRYRPARAVGARSVRDRQSHRPGSRRRICMDRVLRGRGQGVSEGPQPGSRVPGRRVR